MSCEDGDRDWSDAFTGQEIPGLPAATRDYDGGIKQILPQSL